MASVGAYECDVCGGLRYTAEGSTDPLLAPYARLHVCEPRRVAERRYLADPLAEFPSEVSDHRVVTEGNDAD